MGRKSFTTELLKVPHRNLLEVTWSQDFLITAEARRLTRWKFWLLRNSTMDNYEAEIIYGRLILQSSEDHSR